MPDLVNMIILGRGDNAGIALRDIAAGEHAVEAGGQRVLARERIDQGHKIALADIAAGERIIRFGVPVGISTSAIACGHLIHVHNVKSQYLDNEDDHYE